MEEQEKSKITTIKLSQQTKDRLDKLKSHKRETYEGILQEILNILNLCKINPEKARAKLLVLDKIHRKVEKRNSKQAIVSEPAIKQIKPNFKLS